MNNYKNDSKYYKKVYCFNDIINTTNQFDEND